MSFEYSQAEAWEASTDILLEVGNHLVTIKDPRMGDSSNGNPQIELKVENNRGSLRDWIVITPATVGKVVQLFDAVGVVRPQEGEYDPNSGRLTDGCVDRLHNRQVGVVVREEADYKDPSKTRRRIQGYVDKAQVGADAPADPVGVAPSSARYAEDDIPF